MCSHCNITQELINFPKTTNGKTYRNKCKKCCNIRRQKIVRIYPVLTKNNCIHCNTTKSINNFNKNRRFPTGVMNICNECRAIVSKERYSRKSEMIKKRTSRYYYDNKEAVLKQRLSRQKERLKTDPMYRAIRRLRCRLYDALKCHEWVKHSHFREYIGCTLPELKAHFESLFIEDMSWENMGEWHIDHKIPLITAKTEVDLYKLCHYTNLQPLWALDNLRKASKLSSK